LRNFVLVRHQDLTGVSGTGIVAEGVEFTNGKVCMVWLTRPAQSLVIHENIVEVEVVHGHNGATTIQWLDQEEKADENQSHCHL
jgi:hypothetical protein